LAWPFSFTVMVVLLGRPVRFGAVTVTFIRRAFLVESASKAFVTGDGSAQRRREGHPPALAGREGSDPWPPQRRAR
jgi:hypothetical protein